MKRAILSTLLLLTLATPAVAQSPDPDWRAPMPSPVDRLQALDAAMAPALAPLKDDVAAVLQDIGTATDPTMLVKPEALQADLANKAAAAASLATDLQALQDLARLGVAALMGNQPDPCWSQYWAVSMAGWLLLGDAVDDFNLGDINTSGQEVGAADYLLTTYGDLVHAQAIKDCA